MMLVAYRLIQRNAAKEQRKGRANQGSLDTRDELSMWTEDQYSAQG
jgi:hypothetical protein